MMILLKSLKSVFVVPPHRPSRRLKKQKREPREHRGVLMMILKQRQRGLNEKRKGRRRRMKEPELLCWVRGTVGVYLM
jgi:hypothetical protein